MRTDLPSMNPGKAMAQASHVSNAFVADIDDRTKQEEALWAESKSVTEAALEWKNTTCQGFGTVLVLGCDLVEIENVDLNIVTAKLQNQVVFDYLHDPTYPYIVNLEVKDLIDRDFHTEDPHELESGDFVCFRNEVTCAYLFADKNSETTKKLVGHLKLHP